MIEAGKRTRRKNRTKYSRNDIGTGKGQRTNLLTVVDSRMEVP
jgi:hypothetical protein